MRLVSKKNQMIKEDFRENQIQQNITTLKHHCLISRKQLEVNLKSQIHKKTVLETSLSMALLESFRQWSEKEAWISASRGFGTTNQFQDLNLLLVFIVFCRHSTSQTSFPLRHFSSTLLCHRKILIPAFFWFPHRALQHFLTLCRALSR